MSLEDLQAIATNYDVAYFNESDKRMLKTVLDLVVGILAALEASTDTNDTKIDALEERVEALED